MIQLLRKFNEMGTKVIVLVHIRYILAKTINKVQESNLGNGFHLRAEAVSFLNKLLVQFIFLI
jgi:hypothetical protein